MRQSILILMAIILASAFAFATSTPPGTSGRSLRINRFLARNGKVQGLENDKKCSTDPSLCQDYSTCCKDSCVDLSTDPLNCGLCGKICKFTDSCCGGKCVDLNYDKGNCGSCGNRCHKGVLCYYGMCNYA